MFSEQTIYIKIEKDLFKFLHVQSGRTSEIVIHKTTTYKLPLSTALEV